MANEKPLILALTEDLFIVPRLEDAARDLGFRFSVIESAAEIGTDEQAPNRMVQLTEPLDGPDARFLRAIVDAQPALLLVDTTSTSIPWDRWIRTLKTAAATRRIPIVAFGPHVAKQALKLAEEAGAEESVTRGRLQASMAEIIRRRARTIDDRALAEACQGSLSGHAAEGLALLNSGQFYEAHESLEAAWMEAPELEGYLYRSLLQIAVACLHVERGNYAGATKMLLRLKQWIDPLPDQCKGVEVATLKLKVAEFSDALEAAGPERIGDIKLRPLPVVLLSAS